jgi:hypothetical protein
VGGTIVVEVPSAATSTYTVRPTGLPATTDTYQTWIRGGTGGGVGTIAGGAPTPPPITTAYVSSTRSNVYHYATCKTAATISQANRQQGTTPPAGKTLHKDCPK